jgi:hypothetical protein|tara:strand:+ start:3827 stop:4378 length:552 start_codon:yes stop_codon:yes gene_type:complete
MNTTTPNLFNLVFSDKKMKDQIKTAPKLSDEETAKILMSDKKLCRLLEEGSRAIEIARKYNFFVDLIIMEVQAMMLSHHNILGIKDKNGDELKHKLILRPSGFIFTRYNKNNTHIAFVFIIPELRRQGLFQRYIDYLKSTTPSISFTTKKRSMVYFAQKNDFKLVGKTKNKNELCYKWEKIYI